MTEIKENALFIADAHYPHHGKQFLDILKKLDSGEREVSQLFLMGDNFDLLFAYNDHIQTFSREAIALLQKLSQKIEIHYFEGNHDFCLKPIFPHMQIYSREEQPAYFKLGEARVGISHGDRYAVGTVYDLYCTLLRRKTTLRLLRPLSKFLISSQMKKLSSKNICHPFEGFESRVGEILHAYGEIDLVIEGHYHQAKVVGKYISLPSLACQQEVALVKDGKVVFTSL